MNKAVFLDRDGVIIKDTGFVGGPGSVELLPKVAQAINILHENGFLAIVISNQSGVARGYFSEEDLEQIDLEIKRRLAEKEACLDGVYYCIHHPEAKLMKYRCECSCRKPEPGMIFEAQKKYEIDLSSSYMIGDSERDVEAGIRSGCRSILISEPVDHAFAEDIEIAENLYDAVVRYIV